MVHSTGRMCAIEMCDAHTRNKWGSGCIIKVWFPECPLLSKNVLQKVYRTEISVHCPEFRGGCFSEVGNLLDFQSRPEALSALGSVSAFRDSTLRLCRAMYD